MSDDTLRDDAAAADPAPAATSQHGAAPGTPAEPGAAAASPGAASQPVSASGTPADPGTAAASPGAFTRADARDDPATPADPTSPVALLQALARALPPEAIDELWIFPARRVGGSQSTVIVASAFEPNAGAATGPEGSDAEAGQTAEAAPDRRRIITARFTLGGDAHARELRQELAEHGAAPAERIGRVVDGVVRRLDDEPAPPRHARIAGDASRWLELLEHLARSE